MCSSTHNGFHILPVMDLAGATFVRPGASFATGGYHFGDGFSVFPVRIVGPQMD